MQGGVLLEAQQGGVLLFTVLFLADVDALEGVVDALVVAEVVLAVEGLVAGGAAEGARLAVDEAVAHQLELGVELLVAVLAGEGQFSGVREHVLCQLAGRAEALAAEATRVFLALAGWWRRGGSGGRCRRVGEHAGQDGDAPDGFDGAETLFDATRSRGVETAEFERHILELGGNLQGWHG